MMPADAPDNFDLNDATGPNSPASVIEALVAQVSCYQRLAKLTSAQHEHVQRGQTDQLLTVLRARQEVLDQASEFEQRIAPAKRDWSNFLDWPGSRPAHPCRDLLRKRAGCSKPSPAPIATMPWSSNAAS